MAMDLGPELLLCESEESRGGNLGVINSEGERAEGTGDVLSRTRYRHIHGSQTGSMWQVIVEMLVRPRFLLPG